LGDDLALLDVDGEDAGPLLLVVEDGLLERHVVDVVAGDAAAGRHAGGHAPRLAAVIEVEAAHVFLADDDDPARGNAGEVEVFLAALHLPDFGAVAEVEALEGGAVGGGEDHLAVGDDRRRRLPVAGDGPGAGLRVRPPPAEATATAHAAVGV